MQVILVGNCAGIPQEMIIQPLPLIGGIIAEIEDLSVLDEFCDVKLFEDMHITAQMDKSRKILNLHKDCQYTGKDVTICVLDTGIEKLDDFSNIKYFRDFVNDITQPYDDNGHGCHVCGIACGNGKNSNGRYKGIAPNANLIVLKTLNSDGQGNAINVLKGMQWVSDNRKKYNIRIVNLSIGTGNSAPDDPLVRGAEALWDSGITVVTAAGNNGPASGTISTPGISKKVITVGCYEDNLANLFNFGGDKIKNFSGRGPTRECVIKPDLVAPGSGIISCNNKNNKPYRILSGTSMSTPMVSGAIALLLEKHNNLTPNQIKYMLKKACKSLELPPNQQGWGLLDINALLSMEV